MFRFLHMPLHMFSAKHVKHFELNIACSWTLGLLTPAFALVMWLQSDSGCSSLLDHCYALLVPSLLHLKFCVYSFAWTYISYEYFSVNTWAWSLFFCVAHLYDTLIDLRIRPIYTSLLLLDEFFKSKTACSCVIILFVFYIISLFRF